MHRLRRNPSRFVLLAALALVCSACASDWPTWGYGPERHGENPSESTLAPGNVAQLRHLWAADLGAGGARLNSAPVFASAINVRGTPTDLLYLGTEHGVFFAVSSTGQPVWATGIGARYAPECTPPPDGVVGASSSAVFDRAGNRLFAAGGDGNVYALNPATGAILPGWPVQVTEDPVHEVVVSALTLFGGHLYVEIGSCGDAVPYHGRIIDVSPSTKSIAHVWYVTGGPTGPNGGGIWAWGGVSVDPGNGDVYAATGNSFANPENSPYADSVVRLTSALVLKAYDTPEFMIIDDDFGSTPTLFQKSGCPPQLVVAQKNGSLYLYDRDSIATGYRQRILFGRPDLITVATYSGRTKMVYVVNGQGSADGTYQRGLAAFVLDPSCNLRLAWQKPANLGSATTASVANGVVYATGGLNGTMFAFDAVTGAALWNSGTTVPGAFFAEPIVIKGHLYAAGWDGHLHAWGL